MNKRICIKDLIHDFFLIKGHEHLMSNYSVISLYNSNPGLFAIAEKHQIDVVLVYHIMREYRLNQLNKNVISSMKENIECQYHR